MGKEITLSPVELGSQMAKKVKINLASGNPDPKVMPINEIKDAYNQVIQEYGFKSLIYPGAGGQEDLIYNVNKFFLPMLGLNKRTMI